MLFSNRQSIAEDNSVKISIEGGSRHEDEIREEEGTIDPSEDIYYGGIFLMGQISMLQTASSIRIRIP
jgi:hypothetical protein